MTAYVGKCVSEDELQDWLDNLNEVGHMPELAGCDNNGQAFLAALVDLGDEAPLRYYALDGEGRPRDDKWQPSFPAMFIEFPRC